MIKHLIYITLKFIFRIFIKILIICAPAIIIFSAIFFLISTDLLDERQKCAVAYLLYFFKYLLTILIVSYYFLN